MVRALQGVPASGGRASGPVHLAFDRAASIHVEADPIAQLRRAIDAAGAELETLAGRRRAEHPEGAAVLEAQSMLVRDPSLEDEVRDALARGSELGDAVASVFDAHARSLEELGGSGVGSRAADVREAGRHVLSALAGRSAARIVELDEPAVVVARELAPADILAVAPRLLLGIVTEVGGVNSHAAIVARELGVPAVVGLEGAVQLLRSASGVEVDGDAGTVLPGRERGPIVRARAGARLELDGIGVRIMANVGSLAAAEAAAGRGAMGIGLFRTELLLLGRDDPLDEAEQLDVYAGACRAMAPHPVVIRTFDMGSDKALPGLAAAEPNPALGRRGVRLWLARPDLARPQVRAALRCRLLHDNVRVMLPMIAAREELLAVRALFEEEAAAIGGPIPPLGITVETPAAALQMPALAGHITFASLGTNDLVQYALAADRELEWGDELSERNPGARRLIQIAITESRAAGVEIGACGEMAGTPEGARTLVAMGVDSLSMAIGSMESVVEALRRAP